MWEIIFLVWKTRVCQNYKAMRNRIMACSYVIYMMKEDNRKWTSDVEMELNLLNANRRFILSRMHFSEADWGKYC